ncbi:60S ribosomal protein L9 [Rhizoctonia solani AG-1 IA]|uniref:60S ribosomal protein L9 n=1 Tax=Thanatephorus cucumeris (strain AG1-IA) TaxID=983506 RepID=L8X8S1_THACA|nr:60S ribosomal protein L9 [Rhizoctonia solani AG-1 IA]
MLIDPRTRHTGVFGTAFASEILLIVSRQPQDPQTSFKMRDVLSTEELTIPEGVTVAIKSRLINVEGPRGKLVKNVRHVNMDIQLVKSSKENQVTLAVWQGGRKHVACLRTIKSVCAIQGFRYKMRAVYAHFPINCIIQDGGKKVEIRNFLGEKVGVLVRHVAMLDGVTISESKAQKDELILEGNDVQNVSQSGVCVDPGDLPSTQQGYPKILGWCLRLPQGNLGRGVKDLTPATHSLRMRSNYAFAYQPLRDSRRTLVRKIERDIVPRLERMVRMIEVVPSISVLAFDASAEKAPEQD